MSDLPLHPPPVYPADRWWACSEPERPHDMLTVYDDRCPLCLVKLRILLREQSEHTLVGRNDRGEPMESQSVEKILAGVARDD